MGNGKYMNLENQLSKYSNKTYLKRPSEDTRQYVYRILSTLIINMILIPGQRMNEQELSSFMNVSRTPLHDTFPKLSRNNLIEIIPMKGSFVTKVDKQRIEESIWLNKQICISIIQGIFITNAKVSELNILREILSQLEYNCIYNDFLRASRSFYHHLFILGGNFDKLWSSLYEYESDLFRLYSLALKNPEYSKRIYKSLSMTTDALINRDNDLACQFFSAHMEDVLSMVSPITSESPELFNVLIS